MKIMHLYLMYWVGPKDDSEGDRGITDGVVVFLHRQKRPINPTMTVTPHAHPLTSQANPLLLPSNYSFIILPPPIKFTYFSPYFTPCTIKPINPRPNTTSVT